MIISICGKSGSGKSTLTKQLIDYYNDLAIHIDIDKIGHYVNTIPAVLEEEVKTFGLGILTDGKVDRKKLGAIVFNDDNEMAKLTDITWKYMDLEIKKIIDFNKEKLIILDWQLLPKTHYFDSCDLKILLDVPLEIRKERILKRDNITEEQFYTRESASIDYSTYKFDIIQKEVNFDEIKRKVNL